MQCILTRMQPAPQHTQHPPAHTVQATNNALRTQLGLPQPVAQFDLTSAGFDFLHLERERLAAEQVGSWGSLCHSLQYNLQCCHALQALAMRCWAPCCACVALAIIAI